MSIYRISRYNYFEGINRERPLEMVSRMWSISFLAHGILLFVGIKMFIARKFVPSKYTQYYQGRIKEERACNLGKHQNSHVGGRMCMNAHVIDFY